jgi:hypothetical protein
MTVAQAGEEASHGAGSGGGAGLDVWHGSHTGDCRLPILLLYQHCLLFCASCIH